MYRAILPVLAGVLSVLLLSAPALQAGTKKNTTKPQKVICPATLATLSVQLDTDWSGDKTESYEKAVTLPQLESLKAEVYNSHPQIAKTVFLVKVAETIQKALEHYEKSNGTWDDGEFDGGVISPATVMPFTKRGPQPGPEGNPEGKTQKKTYEILANSIEVLRQEASAKSWGNDPKIAELFDILSKLSANMKKPQGFGGFLGGGLTRGGIRALSFSALESVHVTTGGAQDMGHFKKVITEGGVPESKEFLVDGMLKEFDLSIPIEGCKGVICIAPEVSIDPVKKELYVQIAMGTGVTPETFRRKPVNISLVLDRSGSMIGTDGTHKQRLDWTKEAAIKTLEKLNDNDFVSVVIFDNKAEVLAEPVKATKENKVILIAKINSIKLGSTTNIYDALGLAFARVDKERFNMKDKANKYEHRVILVSDAGANVGPTESGEILPLITDNSSKRIGMTAIGLGENLNVELADGITRSRGGNYLFVQSGKEMQNFFRDFDFLVTPIAFNVRASLAIRGYDVHNMTVFGAASKGQGQSVQDLVQIPTLFFTGGGGGGAVVVKFDLKETAANTAKPQSVETFIP